MPIPPTAPDLEQDVEAMRVDGGAARDLAASMAVADHILDPDSRKTARQLVTDDLCKKQKLESSG